MNNQRLLGGLMNLQHVYQIQLSDMFVLYWFLCIPFSLRRYILWRNLGSDLKGWVCGVDVWGFWRVGYVTVFLYFTALLSQDCYVMKSIKIMLKKKETYWSLFLFRLHLNYLTNSIIYSYIQSYFWLIWWFYFTSLQLTSPLHMSLWNIWIGFHFTCLHVSKGWSSWYPHCTCNLTKNSRL